MYNSVHNFYMAILDHHQHYVTVKVLRQLRTISTVYIQYFSVHNKGLQSAKETEQSLRITKCIILIGFAASAFYEYAADACTADKLYQSFI
jgi:hypothetical protein